MIRYMFYKDYLDGYVEKQMWREEKENMESSSDATAVVQAQNYGGLDWGGNNRDHAQSMER